MGVHSDGNRVLISTHITPPVAKAIVWGWISGKGDHGTAGILAIGIRRWVSTNAATPGRAHASGEAIANQGNIFHCQSIGSCSCYAASSCRDCDCMGS
ncbi:MAG: hypothetical protein DDT29_02014 [Dehalococcoidia bacterium]|nr:hypothetical protein [Bacillota bacterium]